MSYTQGFEQDKAMGCVCDYDVDCPTHGPRNLCGDEPKPTVCNQLQARMDAHGLRGLWLPAVKVTRAKDSSTNPGALYLRDGATGDYIGKITATGEVRTIVVIATPIREQLKAFVIGGLDYLDAVGKATGQCCYCGLELTDPDSVGRGYGPVCAKKYGLDHPNRHGF